MEHTEILIEPTAIAPLTVRIREASRLTGIGRSKLYELIADGEVEIIKVGAITLIPLSALEAFVSRQREQTIALRSARL